ncbi:uncharacterized protein LOC127710499 isoform X6 [Mytilus californianus]|uniref:uncharacterized protein LOC127710499 isoform X6 n=1 Tax=Mytilus californianus TaxID=6549 RepID=UPI0022475E29|nr:uncharacterized protein LOC127710499 isoform X6 [Mytilus californianus]
MPREKKHTVKPMEKKGKSDKGKDVEIIGSKRKLKVKYTVKPMEKKGKSDKGKDVEKIGSKRKLKVKYTVETMEKKEKSEKGKDVEKIGSKRKLKVKSSKVFYFNVNDESFEDYLHMNLTRSNDISI